MHFLRYADFYDQDTPTARNALPSRYVAMNPFSLLSALVDEMKSMLVHNDLPPGFRSYGPGYVCLVPARHGECG